MSVDRSLVRLLSVVVLVLTVAGSMEVKLVSLSIEVKLVSLVKFIRNVLKSIIHARYAVIITEIC